MGAYEAAATLLGDLVLSAGQLAELRAIDHKYQQRLFTLLHQDGGGAVQAAREPTQAELSGLDAMVAADILAMLTPTQRQALHKSDS